MFRQLRNRFLILNLVIISIMMMVSFTSIYLITYNNVHRDIDMEMNKLFDMDRKPIKGPKEPKPGNADDDIANHAVNRSPFFILNLDNNNKITGSFSTFEIDESIFEKAKEAALSSHSNGGSFKLEDTYWRFMIKQSPDSPGNKLVFLDITSRHEYLTNLIYTFLAVAFVMLIAIFFISKFFANKAIKPIKENFNRQKQFIADASHELKTPLAVINTNTEVLLSNSDDTVKNQSKWIYYIKSEVERMTKLTNDLLYLAQADNSDTKLVSHDFDLSEAVENVILTMEATIFENNKILDYNIEPKVISYGNSEQIKQVVMILLDNALKYTEPNGSISLSLKKYNNKAVMAVSNTGKGIPEEHLSHIFDRFYRIDKSRSKESGGYGLGLAIAKTIVEQHSGKIFAKSVVDDTTTFTVELPA